jgi:hypothetical protein
MKTTVCHFFGEPLAMHTSNNFIPTQAATQDQLLVANSTHHSYDEFNTALTDKI